MMDTHDSWPRHGPLILAASALVLLGLSLSVLTWRNLSQQRRLIDQHVLFAARTILRGLEASLSRSMPMMSGLTPEARKAKMEEMFRAMVQPGDVLYLGVYGEDGGLLLSSSPSGAPREGQAPGQDDIILDPLALSDLTLNGEWFGTMNLGTNTIMGYAANLRPDGPWPNPARDTDPSPGPATSPQKRMYLLVGLSLDEHYAQYQALRRAAIFQTGFVLAAAVLVWIPLFAFLRRKEQGLRLKHLESFHSKLLDALPEALVTVGPNGLVRAANPAAQAILGQQLVGQTFALSPFGAALAQKDLAGQAGVWQQMELAGRFLEVLTVPLAGETLVLARDRTQLRTLEQGLEDSRRLAAIGRLSAQVAHEVRNPLSALRGFAQFFATKLKGREPEQSYAQTMVAEADRLDRVVTDLLYLARPKPLDLKPVVLADMAQDLERLMQFDLGRAQGLWQTALETPNVLADPDSLKQALINLILNSLAALPPSGGTLILGSRTVAGGVEVSLADTGQGLDQEACARILEPFPSGKRQGAGLGLAMVQKVARDHQGRLSIESSPGQGAIVRLFFPEAG